MIVRQQPSALQLFFVMQGSVVPRILTTILGVALLSAAILLIDRFVLPPPHISIAAMGVFGIALSLFLGFRNNAAYDRWWEGRQLWGALIADIRNLGRHLSTFTDDQEERAYILSHAVAFAHLHRGFLRDVDVAGDVAAWVGEDRARQLMDGKNPADAALRGIADRVGGLRRRETISGFAQMTIAQTLAALASAQAGCERIATTPLPFVYSLLVRRTTYLYCLLLPFALIETTSLFMPLFAAVVAYIFFGLQAVTNELEQPFTPVANGLPLDAMCRTIEISVAEALDREAPEMLQPANHMLS